MRAARRARMSPANFSCTCVQSFMTTSARKGNYGTEYEAAGEFLATSHPYGEQSNEQRSGGNQKTHVARRSELESCVLEKEICRTACYSEQRHEHFVLGVLAPKSFRSKRNYCDIGKEKAEKEYLGRLNAKRKKNL